MFNLADMQKISYSGGRVAVWRLVTFPQRGGDAYGFVDGASKLLSCYRRGYLPVFKAQINNETACIRRSVWNLD